MTTEDIDILSVSKYVARKDYICAWSHEPNQHMITKGRKYIRCVWENQDGEMQTDHICIECWCK